MNGGSGCLLGDGFHFTHTNSHIYNKQFPLQKSSWMNFIQAYGLGPNVIDSSQALFIASVLCGSDHSISKLKPFHSMNVLCCLIRGGQIITG